MQEKKKRQEDLIKNDVLLFGIEWKKFDISLFCTGVIAILIMNSLRLGWSCASEPVSSLLLRRVIEKAWFWRMVKLFPKK